MGAAYVLFTDRLEGIEVFISVDVMGHIGLKVEMITVTPGEIMTSAHGVPVLRNKNIMNCNFFDADLTVFPGGMSDTITLGECDDLRKLAVRFTKGNKPISAICTAPMVFGKLGLLKGRKATCYPGFDNFLEGTGYTVAMAEKDDNIIMGEGSGIAMEFALAVVEPLQGKDKVTGLRKAMII